jgi:hypothetical protein
MAIGIFSLNSKDPKGSAHAREVQEAAFKIGRQKGRADLVAHV